MTEGNEHGRRGGVSIGEISSLAGLTNNWCTVLNARIRRIDLFCKLVGPLAISLIDGASTLAAIWTALGMNILSVTAEYVCIAQVCQHPWYDSYRLAEPLMYFAGLQTRSQSSKEAAPSERRRRSRPHRPPSRLFGEEPQQLRIWINTLEAPPPHRLAPFLPSPSGLPPLNLSRSFVLYRSLLFRPDDHFPPRLGI